MIDMNKNQLRLFGSHTQKEDRPLNDFIDPIFSCREQVKGNDASLKYVIYIEQI